MKTFPLHILRINETVFAGEAKAVNAPGAAGDVTILANHETMLTSLTSGELMITLADDSEERIKIDHGFLEATAKNVTVLL